MEFNTAVMVMVAVMFVVPVFDPADHVGICPEPVVGIPMAALVFVHVKVVPTGLVI
jgi:hypothetical protein